MSDMYFRFSGDPNYGMSDSVQVVAMTCKFQVYGRFSPNLYKKAQIVEILLIGFFEI